MRKIRIFIGSSIEELKIERLEIMRFLYALNNDYVDRGFYIEFYVCEETSASMVQGGSQKRYNQYIEEKADTAVFLFFKKAGQYTMEELELAHDRFQKEQRPDVFIFFKVEKDAAAPEESVRDCVRRISEDFGHYYKLFKNTDTIKLELLQYLVDTLKDGSELSVRDGAVLLNGAPLGEDLLKLENVFAYQNSGNLKELKAELARLLKEMTEASARGDLNEALRISEKLRETQETYHTLERDILEMLKQFSVENRKGQKADPRRMEALRLLELGRIDEAKALISQEELTARDESLASRQALAEEAFQAEAEELVEDALVRIFALKQDVRDPGRFDAIDEAYASVSRAAKTAKRYDLLYQYASFLHEQKNYPKAIAVAENLRRLYHAAEEEIPEAKRADLLNLLGILYKENGDPKKAEQQYLQALEIYRRLASEADRKDCEADVAMACNNLAAFYSDSRQPKKAEKLYLEALEIYRRLASEVDRQAYEPYVAGTGSNLADLYAKYGPPEEAERLYREALAIRRRLAAEVSRDAYEPDLAVTCNSLAVFYDNRSQPEEAEKLYREALAIRRRLAAEVDCSAYEPDLAASCNNLANYCSAVGQTEEAEELLLEALEIYRRLASEVSREAYEPMVATVSYSLAFFYANYRQPEAAERLYQDALEIRERLASEVDRDVYEPDVLQTLNGLAGLYFNYGYPEEAEKRFREALDICLRLASEVDRDVFEPDVALISYNLMLLYTHLEQPEEAEPFRSAALEIAGRYKDTNPVCRTIWETLSS